MCGRAYETYTEEELAIRYLNRKPVRIPKWKPTYNLAPTQQSPVVRVRDNEKTIDLLRFGLIPSWARDVQSAAKYSLINAKSEEIDQKRSYKEPFQKRRCIVPVSGFFEWLSGGKGSKRPFAIRLKGDPIMSLAGVWEHWEPADIGETRQAIDSFSIITTRANALIAPLHERMPVILTRDMEEDWLNPDNTGLPELKRVLQPYPPEQMELFEVSSLVNSPKNNSPEILEPVRQLNLI